MKITTGKITECYEKCPRTFGTFYRYLQKLPNKVNLRSQYTIIHIFDNYLSSIGLNDHYSISTHNFTTTSVVWALYKKDKIIDYNEEAFDLVMTALKDMDILIQKMALEKTIL